MTLYFLNLEQICSVASTSQYSLRGGSESKHTDLAAQSRRIASRRGAKRAAMALAHSMLVMISHLLRERTSYREVGETSFEERDRQAEEKQLVRRLTCLGYQVELQPLSQAGYMGELHLTDLFRRVANIG